MKMDPLIFFFLHAVLLPSSLLVKVSFWPHWHVLSSGGSEDDGKQHTGVSTALTPVCWFLEKMLSSLLKPNRAESVLTTQSRIRVESEPGLKTTCGSAGGHIPTLISAFKSGK